MSGKLGIQAAAAGTRRRPATTRSVVLIGFMGAGKSSVGRALGEQLGWAFEDLDDRIEEREQRKVAEIFRQNGESGFRRAERAALKEMLNELQSGAKRVIALGGGAFVQPSNVQLIAAAGAPTVFLHAEVTELWERCRGQAGMERPLLGSLQTFRDLYRSRQPHYAQASFRQDTSGKPVNQIARELIRSLGLTKSRSKRGDKQ